MVHSLTQSKKYQTSTQWFSITVDNDTGWVISVPIETWKQPRHLHIWVTSQFDSLGSCLYQCFSSWAKHWRTHLPVSCKLSNKVFATIKKNTFNCRKLRSALNGMLFKHIEQSYLQGMRLTFFSTLLRLGCRLYRSSDA